MQAGDLQRTLPLVVPPALAFELAPEHAAALVPWRDGVAPWRVPFEIACSMLMTHLRAMAGLWTRAVEADDYAPLATRLMALIRLELESMFSASVLGDTRVALYERRDGAAQAWLVDERDSWAAYGAASEPGQVIHLAKKTGVG